MNELNKFFQNPQFFIIIFIWSLILKGIALWRAAGNRHITWFAILLTINTLGLLEILYILYLYRYELGSKKLLALISDLKKKYHR